jgi:hypothetical protein
MNKYFEIVNLGAPCVFILKDNSRFDLRTGIPNNALAVFKTGFNYLGLKPGAEKQFKKESEAEILALVNVAKRIEDLEVLAFVKPDSDAIKSAVEVKRAQFTTK